MERHTSGRYDTVEPTRARVVRRPGRGPGRARSGVGQETLDHPEKSRVKKVQCSFVVVAISTYEITTHKESLY